MSLKSSNKIETNVYELEVTIGAEEFKAAVSKAFNKNKGKINVPGWRKGKAPRSMIEAIYGKNVFYDEALESLYPQAVDEAIKAAELIAVDTPYDVDVKEIGDNGVEMTMKVTVKPEIEVTSYKGIEAPKPVIEITEDDVKAELDKLLERNSRIVTVDDRAAQDGDTAVIDFEGFVDDVAFEGGKGENHDLVLGSGQFIPGFEEQIIGHNSGEEFDVNVTFPEEYTDELKGKAAVFKVKLNEIKKKELPELDDEFAKDVSEYDSLDELKKSLEENLFKSKTDSVNARFEDDVLKQLAENVEGEIPEIMFTKKADENKENFSRRISQQGIDLDTYLMYMGVDKEKFDEDMLEQAQHQVKARLALEKIVAAEGIEISDEEIEAEYTKLSEQYGVGVDAVKSYFDAEGMKSDLACEKAIKVVTDNAVIVEAVEVDVDNGDSAEDEAE